MKSTRIHNIELLDPNDNDKDRNMGSRDSDVKQNNVLTNIWDEKSKRDLSSSMETNALMIRLENIEEILAKLVEKESFAAKNTDDVITECRK